MMTLNRIVINILWSNVVCCCSAIVLLLSWSASTSQTIQIGPGFGESWNQDASPVNIRRRRTVCQFVYTSTELNEASAPSINPLTALGFFVIQEPGEVLVDYTIKLRHVTVADVSSPLGGVGWTEVAGPFDYEPTAGGYDMITLDTPFLWNGVDNIGVEICWARVARRRNRGTVRIYGAENGFTYRTEDGGGTSCGDVPNEVRPTKPHIQMVFAPGNTTTWTGSSSADWFDHSNWDTGVPNRIMDAVIPSTAAVMPKISGQAAVTRNITVNAGATLSVPGYDSINVFGDWQMNGSFDYGSSTVILQGFRIATTTLNGVADQEFYNLEVRSAAGATLSSGTYQVFGSLRLRGGAFTSNNLITLRSNSDGTGRMSRVSNICGYQLDMTDHWGDPWNGGFVTLNVDGQTVDHYSAINANTVVDLPIPNGSSYSIIYTAGNWEEENSYLLIDPNGITEYDSGIIPPVGLVHSGVATCAFANPFVGEISIQRYLPVGNIGWRYMSSGVQNQSLQDWRNDGITMSGFPGSDFPSFGWSSVLAYNENNANGDKNNGWVSATDISDAIDFKKGHRVYIGSAARTTEVTGPPLVGTQTVDLDYQDDAGSFDQEGWNLIGNPYVCSIDWDSISLLNKVAIDDAIWIWNATAGNFGVYVGGTGGFGTNDVGADIASSQAFWVHANDLNPQITFMEENKSEADPRFVKSIENKTQLKLRLESDVNPYYDEAILAWRNDASDDLDDKDGVKLFSPIVDAPSLGFKPGSVPLSINSVSTTSPHLSISVQVLAGETGNHKIIATELDKLMQVPCIILEDLVLDSLIDFHQDTTYEFFQSTLFTGDRFVLHVGQWYNGAVWDRCWHLPNQDHQDELTLGVEDDGLVDFNLYPNPVDDILFVELDEGSSFRSGSMEVLSITGSVLMSKEVDGLSQINVGPLANGMYILRLIGDNNETLLRTFVKQ